MPDRKPLKVLYLSAEGLLGGAERSLYELLTALPEDRVEAHACVPPEGSLARLCALAEVPVHPVPLRRFRRTLNVFLLFGQVRALFHAAKDIGQLVADLGIDLLHANTDSAALVAWEVARETGCPFVWHCRDLRPLGPMTKALGSASVCAVAISNAVAEHLRLQGVPVEHIRKVLNGVDLRRFAGVADEPRHDAVRAQTRGYLGVGADEPLLIDIGGWVPWKRHELFLEALAKVRQTHPHARGLLVGSDLFQQNSAYAELLDARIEDLGLEDALLVLQQRDDIPELLAASDVLVSTSEREPFGRVLVEAAAAGLPVVSTASGGKVEIVEHGVTGLLTPPGEAGPLAEACASLLGDSAKRMAMGAAARKRAAGQFDILRTAQEMVTLYEDLVAKKA